MEALRKAAFLSWFSDYGPVTGSSKYVPALADPHGVVRKRKVNPSQGHVQAANLDMSKFPPPGRSCWCLTSPQEVGALFKETGSFRVGDDGTLHTALGYYALWLRWADMEDWWNEPSWADDDSASVGRSRKATLLAHGFDYDHELAKRRASYKMDKYLAAIRTKPFILLAGISGTGKSRLVRQLARGFCPAKGVNAQPHPFATEPTPGNFAIIPVRPNWHDSTELMGYESRLNGAAFVIKPFAAFLVKAWRHPGVPFFLCLDEMNLAPVEQYFAEYLSAIESRKRVTGGGRTYVKTDVVIRMGEPDARGWDDNGKGVLHDALNALFGTVAPTNAWDAYLRDLFTRDGGISIPENLVVMGTVNMDETTCTFSRKVLDRAMSFELNDVSDMYAAAGLAGEADLPFGCLAPADAACALLTGQEAYKTDPASGDRILAYLKAVNEKLEGTPFKIAYRSRNEILTYCRERMKGGVVGLRRALDEATSMKILSRIEGDDQRFAHFKLDDFRQVVCEELLRIDNAAVTPQDVAKFLNNAQQCAASPSVAKLGRMAAELQSGAGFVSFWEC